MWPKSVTIPPTYKYFLMGRRLQLNLKKDSLILQFFFYFSMHPCEFNSLNCVTNKELKRKKKKPCWHRTLKKRKKRKEKLWKMDKVSIKNRTKEETRRSSKANSKRCFKQNNSSSPRSISIVQLNTLLCVHLRPIKLVVYKWPYSFKMMGYLILRRVSRLDAFSVYHFRTRLPGYALGRTTDAPEVRPTRSSRTKVSSSQISNAHDR